VFTRKEDTIWRGSQVLALATPLTEMNYALDHLGSPRLITSAVGGVIDQQNFDPFGEGGLFGSGALQFTGHERDRANLGGGVFNLPDYFHARFYDKGGRFLSVDPVIDVKQSMRNPQGWNRYAYVRNNPVRLTDPTGLYTCSGTVSECRAFEGGLMVLRAAASEAARQKLQSAGKLAKVVELYGAKGTKNGVAVTFGKTDLGGRIETVVAKGAVNITVDREIFTQDQASQRAFYVSLGVSATHEGTHGLQGRADPGLATTKSRSILFLSEQEAYRTGAYIYQSLGFDDTEKAIWSHGTFTPLLDHWSNQSTDMDCAARGGCSP
jgi:RHS repeat-associated protein